MMKRKIIILILTLFFFLFATPVFALKSTDVDGNGIVNAQDIRLILENWLVKVSSVFDIDENLKVNSLDLGYVIKDFGKVISTPTPYPTSPPSSTEWTQFGHDPQRTAYNPQNLGSNWSLKWIWNASTGSDHLFYGFDVQPITGDGKIYVGDLNGRMHAISDSTGSDSSGGGWVYQADNSPINHTAAFDNQNLYFATQNGKIYKVNSSGQLQTSRQLNGEIYAAPLIVNSTLYIGTASNYFYALNTSNLADKWSVKQLGGQILAPAAYSARNNTLYVEAENMLIYALNADNGNFVWSQPANVGGNGRVSFAHTYPAVADNTNVLVVRTDVQPGSYACNLLWDGHLDQCAPADCIRANRNLETFFVLKQSDGTKQFDPAPVVYGAEEQNFNSGCYGRSVPPQAVIKKVSASEDVAYVIWRQGAIKPEGTYAQRVDATFGEMNLTTGNIRYVQNAESVNRLATDEQAHISMAGDVFFSHNWQAIGASRIDRTRGDGSSGNPLPATGLYALMHSVYSGESCAGNANHFCSGGACAPPDCTSCDSKYCFSKSAFFLYTSSRFSAMSPPQSMGYERRTHVVISNGSVYYKTSNGAIMALSAQ